MNIKTIIGQVWPIGRNTSEISKEIGGKPIKSDSTTDRDGNGQMPFHQGQGQDQQPMSDEEFAQALEKFKKLPVIKDKNLMVETQIVDHKRCVILKEASGKVLRRIMESELSILLQAQDKDKGRILSKSA
jgi:hypothetical protein